MSGRVVSAAVLVPVAIAMGGCAAPTPENCQMNHTATGAAIGVVSGAALGAGIAALSNASAGVVGLALVGGAIVGGVVGAIAGQQQDKACREMALKMALDQAAALNEARAKQPTRAPRPAGAPTRATSQAAASSQTTYQSVAWANKMTNNSGTITPLGVASDAASDQLCMSYSDQQTVNGQVQTVTGKACRTPDGEWKPVT